MCINPNGTDSYRFANHLTKNPECPFYFYYQSVAVPEGITPVSMIEIVRRPNVSYGLASLVKDGDGSYYVYYWNANTVYYQTFTAFDAGRYITDSAGNRLKIDVSPSLTVPAWTPRLGTIRNEGKADGTLQLIVGNMKYDVAFNGTLQDITCKVTSSAPLYSEYEANQYNVDYKGYLWHTYNFTTDYTVLVSNECIFIKSEAGIRFVLRPSKDESFSRINIAGGKRIIIIPSSKAVYMIRLDKIGNAVGIYTPLMCPTIDDLYDQIALLQNRIAVLESG